MVSVRIDRMALQVPSTWDDLPGRALAALMLARAVQQPVVQRLLMVQVLLGVRLRRLRLWWTWVNGLNGYERHSLLPLADPFLQQAPMRRTVVQALPRRWRKPLPVVEQDLLNHLDAELWGTADTLFLRWQRNGGTELLRMMAAVLYAPRHYTRRDRLQLRALPLVRHVHTAWLLAMAANWSGLRLTLVEECPHVFGKGGQADRRGWGEVLVQMSGGKFGPWHTTRTAEARPFLRALNQSICDAKNAQQRAQQARTK